MAELEELVLSGKLFQPSSRSSSPIRAPSPSSSWPTLNLSDDEDDDGKDYDSDKERSKAIDRILSSSSNTGNTGVGVQGRTGVKGVIRDKIESDQATKSVKAREIDELNKKMEKAALSAKTYREEDEERMWEKVMLDGDFPGVTFGEPGKKGRFGHLREVGARGYLPAIEQESRAVWVVIHIYSPSLDRCYALDDTLSRLARIHTQTKFIRCRAGAIGFASKPSTSKSRSRSSQLRSSRPRIPGAFIREEDSDEDEGGDGGGGDEDWNEEEEENSNVDEDMLPTLLVYRDGELVHNWVRVDWEAGRAGVEELLVQHNIIEGFGGGNGNCGLPSDDEDDLLSDEEGF
ncbi:hypothetical protein JAAARDRAFT_42123 [Jaapia argillacea MUCL 33604]|uniref:Phosducin domain-containing protein n=1 Tax=Jaapia argillacea MUCL 33604 TaxID=933084 RepID=A0A067P6T6_9AGAM|nr:hypothetical protein JAAARDRAFT_42123 [Jaapia argillacea MUCL 33604]